VRLTGVAGSLLIVAAALAQNAPKSPEKLTFEGRQVTIISPETDEEDFAKDPASVCIEGPPLRQCYTMPKEFGRNPTATVIQLRIDEPALLFSAESNGVSGWQIHYALLRLGNGKDLINLLWGDVSVSNLGQDALWSLPEISGALVFVTADFIWGPYESHFGEHRYMVSSYVYQWETSDLIDEPVCSLQDRYMTTRYYDSEQGDVLKSEKSEIVSRLRKVQAEEKRRQESDAGSVH
jgi:hypothetical protein